MQAPKYITRYKKLITLLEKTATVTNSCLYGDAIGPHQKLREHCYALSEFVAALQKCVHLLKNNNFEIADDTIDKFLTRYIKDLKSEEPNV